MGVAVGSLELIFPLWVGVAVGDGDSSGGPPICWDGVGVGELVGVAVAVGEGAVVVVGTGVFVGCSFVWVGVGEVSSVKLKIKASHAFPSWPAAGRLDGAAGDTGCEPLLYNLNAVNTAIPANIKVANTMIVVTSLSLFIFNTKYRYLTGGPVR